MEGILKKNSFIRNQAVLYVACASFYSLLMRLVHTLLVLITSLLLHACGRAPSAGKKHVPIEPEEIAQIMENQGIVCATIAGGHCPEGVARLFIINPADTARSALCTGFLVNGNRIVTNHHCLSRQDQCEQTYVAVFDGLDTVKARCSRIIAALDDGRPLDDKAVDVTVFELDRPLDAIRPFAAAESLPPFGSTLSVWVLDHHDLYTARLTELACSYESKLDSIELGNCAAISGNSGSPVLDNNERVLGVLWGSTTDLSVNDSTDLDERRSRPDFSYATELEHFRSYIP